MEFEVFKEAVSNYKKYNVYSNWVLFGGEKSKRPFRPSMCGYYLQSDDFPDCTIVGDILTSNKIWGNARERNNPQINRALDLFESIYHMDGNYIPIPEIRNEGTGNLSGNNCDTYTHHLNVCKQVIEGTLKEYKVWQRWTKEIWIPYCSALKCNNPWLRFVKEYYLLDFVDENMQPKSFVVGRNLSNQVGIRAQDRDESILATITECIELIIMRDYRIKKNITTSFDSEQRKKYYIYRQDFLKKYECD
ncbi:hypothetical protein [Acetoanaerobium sticklandii]|uniref:hypothetical protein n=1 Tax=Acetoanaerobium sticklandii TaxID=1511 RepID=UPI003A9258C1